MDLSWRPQNAHRQTEHLKFEKIVREWAACVHFKWAAFSAMLEAATEEEH